MGRLTWSLSLLLALPACIGPPGGVCFPWVYPAQPPSRVEAPTASQVDTPPGEQPRAGLESGEAPAPAPARTTSRPWVEAGLFFSDDAAWVTTRTRLTHSGFIDTGFLFADDAFALHIGAMRVQQALDESPLSLGVGLGFYGTFIDEPDENMSSLTLSALAAYPLETSFPTRFVAQVSFAPDATTFGDAEGLIDAKVGAEVAIGSHAAATLGYRFFEVDLDEDAVEDTDATLTDGLYFGVSLGF